MSADGLSQVGVVAIGRNEGERLKRCLHSVVGRVSSVVYVDSGSTDDSVAFARSLGIEVVELDVATPFSAARARNAGFERLVQRWPYLEYVQFVDGDCKVVDGWLDAAAGVLNEESDVAVVCGRRRERHPESTIYNKLCDMEWDTPVGEAGACGGDALMRVGVVRRVGGYDPTVIAAEDDELCVRIRLLGFRILRIEHDMTLHDADMTRTRQWWKRAMRAGHGYAQVSSLHGRTPLRYFVSRFRRVLIWGIGVPFLVVGTLVPSQGWTGLILLIYPLRAIRTAFRRWGHDRNVRAALAYGTSCTVAAFPQALGAIRFHLNRMVRTENRIIEYK